MLKKNKKFQIEYRMLLNKTFIETIDEKECEEILKEIEKVYQEEFPFFAYELKYYFVIDMKEQIDFDRYTENFGMNFPTYVEELDDIKKLYENQWKLNINTENKININQYLLKLELFKRKGNTSAQYLLNKLKEQVEENKFPFLNEEICFYATHGAYFYSAFYFHLNALKEDVEIGLDDDVIIGSIDEPTYKKRLLCYYQLYYYLEEFDNEPTEEKYQQLVYYWNENVDVWINQIESDKTNNCQSQDIYKIVGRMAMIQKSIGIKMLLMFITHPQSYKKMMTVLPSLIDFIEWIKDDRHCFLYAYLKQEHIEILSELKGSKKELLNEIFGFTKHVYLSPNDFWREKLNVIKYLIETSLDIDKLFINENKEFGCSLSEFYKNITINLGEEKGGKIKEALAEISFYRKLNNELPIQEIHNHLIKI